MRYLGKKSLSSVLSTVLAVSWYVLLLSTVFFAVFGFWNWLREPDPSSLRLQIQTAGLQISIAGEHLQDTFGSNFAPTGIFAAIPSLLLLLVVVHHLRRLLHSLGSDEHPFQHSNCLHMRWVGFAVLGWSVWSSIAQFIVGWQLSHHVSIPGVQLTAMLKPDVNMFILAAVILIMAEVFRMAVALREEQDLTI